MNWRGWVGQWVSLFVLVVSQVQASTLIGNDTTSVVRMLRAAEDSIMINPDRGTALLKKVVRDAAKIKFTRGETEALEALGDFHHSESRFDSSNFYYSRAATLAHSNGNKTLEAHLYSSIGENFMRLYKPDSAIAYLKQSLEVIGNNDKDFEAGVYNNMANVYLNQSRYQEALEYFILSANLYDSINNKSGFSRELSNIGNIEYRLGHLDKAMDYAVQSKRLAEEANFISGVGYAYKLLGWIWRKKGNFQNALHYYDSAMRVYTSLGEKRDVAEIALSMGNASFDLGKFQPAINYYLQALNFSRNVDYKPFIPYAFSGLTYCYYSLNKHDLALQYADSLEAESRENHPYLLLDAYDLRSSIYEKKGDYRHAFEQSRRYLALKDSLVAQENRSALEEAESKFQNDLKQKEIDQLKKERQLESGRRQARQIGIAVALLLTIVIALLIINRFRILNRTRRQIEIERMRNSIARDLHDDIGSALSSINIMSQVAIREPGSQQTQKNLQRIGDQSSRLMESMSDIVWSINPDNDSLERTIVKMREFAVEMLEPKNIQFKMDTPHIPSRSLDSESRKNLFLIFKEAINNSAKYSQCQSVESTIEFNSNLLVLTIRDDGSGFDLSSRKNGNGLRNMKSRAQAIGGKLEIVSAHGNGTDVTLHLPLT